MVYTGGCQFLPMKRIIATVSGRVQGVGYRYYITDRARALGITGYAKNLGDGTVEVIAERKEQVLREFIGMLNAKKDRIILVNGLEVHWADATGEFSGFGIRR
jgi:acylphosphatase